MKGEPSKPNPYAAPCHYAGVTTACSHTGAVSARVSEMFAFCCTAVAGGLSVEVDRTLGHYKLAWACHAGAFRCCGMLSNCRSIRMSPKVGTSSAPLLESGALFDTAAVPDLPACLRPPRRGGAAAGHWLSPPRELEVTQILSDIGVFYVLVPQPAQPSQASQGSPQQPLEAQFEPFWGQGWKILKLSLLGLILCTSGAKAGKCSNGTLEAKGVG